MPNEFYIVPEAALDATADAIRAKTGSQASIEFTQDGFADAIDDIPSGVSYENALLDGSLSGTYENITVTSIKSGFFSGAKYPNVTFYSFPNVVTLYQDAFYQNNYITGVYLPKLQTISGMTCFGYANNNSFTALVLPSLTTIGSQAFRNMKLTSFDILGSASGLGGAALIGCTNLNLIILRCVTAVVACAGTNTFDSTPFASGGTGGTIYIPKALYDHLGDGTSLDYKAATNWSTIDGYGTITWAKIEGSYYETHYADGTLIPT